MSNSHWPKSSLKSLTTRIGDGIHGTPKYVEISEYPFINGNNLRRGFIEILPETKRVSRSEYEKYFIGFDKNTLFLSINGTLGSLAKYRGETVILGKSAAYIKCSRINIGFLYYYLQLGSVQQHMWNVATGSTIKNLSLDSIRNLQIPTPSDNEQRNIAAVLSTLDAKIDCNNRINGELEAMAKSLYDYWFVQFDFPDANGKPYRSSGGKMAYNPALKREIPAGWGSDRLVNLTSLIRRGLSPAYVEEGGILVLNQKCIRDQRIAFADARRHATILESEDKRLLRCFDVLVNSTGVGTLGRVAFVKRLDEEKTTVDSHVTIVRAKPERVSREYLCWSLLRFQPIIEAAANGSTGQVELNKGFLEDLYIVVPVPTLQKQFSEFVDPLIKIMATKEKETEYLIQLRDWLLPMLMNGQVTVGPRMNVDMHERSVGMAI
ncbi:restriction endonuclease subunit S [Sedimenticola hydrogenitrophicus]|uniref:restriction endonuclease subunit S n=1 Tax=Sedimenticola hydrogenitrophicus TaxID=2967975 RepID=UPI0021A91829|nr:restriction endonuclease subunit S [Sedimenticola hydrogenitrophicus]